MDLFPELAAEFLGEAHKQGPGWVFGIIRTFCARHNLVGIDGLPGMTEYAETLARDAGTTIPTNPTFRSLGEIAYMLWALERLDRIDIADQAARSLVTGGDFGDTTAYLTSDVTNHFRNIELQLHVGLRLLEHSLGLQTGAEGEPDYLLDGLSVEVKAPASKLALFQSMLKAVKQVERSPNPGVVIVCLDHMVARGMIPRGFEDMPDDVKAVLLSALPSDLRYRTVGVIAEWVDWTGIVAQCTVKPLALAERGEGSEVMLRRVWSAFSAQDVTDSPIEKGQSDSPFPYPDRFEDMDPGEDGRRFYEDTWGAD